MVPSYHVAATPENPPSVAINRCNISLDLMLQPMLQQKLTFRPMVVEVFTRNVAMPVAIRKALSDPPKSSICGPGGGSDVAHRPPRLWGRSGSMFPSGKGSHRSRKDDPYVPIMALAEVHLLRFHYAVLREQGVPKRYVLVVTSPGNIGPTHGLLGRWQMRIKCLANVVASDNH